MATTKATSSKKAATKVEAVEKTMESKGNGVAKGGAQATAARILEEGDNAAVQGLVRELESEKATAQTQAARVLNEVAVQKPESVTSFVDRFVLGLRSENKRVVQACAEALPGVARVAPARVAKHLDKITGAFAETSDVGKHGIVQTFVALCSASVAYQRRLEPALKVALEWADGKTLRAWTEAVLPALKGEPHANARAVVESRLGSLTKPLAQPIADFLGVKLRVRR